MIFVDANIYLRYLVQPVTRQDRENTRRAAALFAQVDAGEIEVTTSEAIVAEVAFILTSPRHYGATRSIVAAGIKALLRPRACRMPAKDIALGALDLWVAHPELSFPDALGATYSSERGYDLATFDVALSRTPGITVHAWERGGTAS